MLVAFRKQYNLHITYTIQIVNNRAIDTREHDELPSTVLEMAQDPGVIGYINIIAAQSTLDQMLNATADLRDCYVWPYSDWMTVQIVKKTLLSVGLKING